MRRANASRASVAPARHSIRSRPSGASAVACRCRPWGPTNMARREATPEQKAKAEERRAKFRKLAEQIAAMSDEQRAAMAERMGALVTIEGRSLSVHNSCLIGSQNPDATMVGGFNQWLRAGRAVRKGEHGLCMWAPTARTIEASEKAAEHKAATGEETGNLRANFIMVTVFDISQTDPTDEQRPALRVIEGGAR